MKKLTFILLTFVIIHCRQSAFSQAKANARQAVDSAAMIKALKNTINAFSIGMKNKSQSKVSLSMMHYLRGVAEGRLKETTAAIADYSTAISLNPKLAEAYWERGALYLRAQSYKSAIADFEKSVTFYENDKNRLAFLYNTISIAERALKHYDKAIAADSTAIALNPAYGMAYVNRAAAYGGSGKYELAIKDFTTAIYGYQNNQELLSHLFTGRGDMKKALKQYRDAINDYSLSIKLKPDDGGVYWNRAATYFLNGDYQLADDDYSKAITFFQNDKKRLALLYDDRAHMEIGTQHYKKAIADDSLAIALDPGRAMPYWTKAQAQTENGDYQQSIDGYKKIVSLFQNDKISLGSLYSLIAEDEFFLNQFQKALDDCNTSISYYSKSTNTYLTRGRSYLKLGKQEPAINDFKKILEVDSTKNTVDYAFALFYTGDAQKAVQVVQNNIVETTDPDLLLINYYNMACIYSLMNKPDEANSYLKKCLEGGYSKKYAMADTDLDNIRNTPDFKSMMDSAVK